MDQRPVERYGVYEAACHASGHYDNPYTQVDAVAAFTCPDGAVRSIPLFWDGDDVWRVRISPDQVGGWSYVVHSADAGLAQAAGAFQCTPSTRHGGLVIMDRYPFHFARQDGTPVWLMGDTAWRLYATDPAKKVSRETVCHYLDVRAAQGFNYVHSDLMGGAACDGEQKVFLDFAREAPNLPYLREVEARIRYANGAANGAANGLGITCGILLAWAVGAESWASFPSDEARLRYARAIVARYSALDVAFIVSGEWDLAGRDSKPVFQAIGREIMRADPHNRLRAIHPCRTRSTQEFATDDWYSLGDYQQLYQAPPSRESTAAERDSLRNHLLKPKVHGRPVVNAEYAYFLRAMPAERSYHPELTGKGVDREHSHTRESFRRASWVLAMAGGYFVAGFGTTYFGGWRDYGPFDVDAAKNDPAESDLQNIRGLFAALEWWKLGVMDNLVRGDGGYAYCLAELNNTYLVYSEGNSRVMLTPDGGATVGSATVGSATVGGADSTYRVRRYDPRTGAYEPLPDAAADRGAGHTSLALPAPDRGDWVFLLQRKQP